MVIKPLPAKQVGITFGYCDEKTGQRVYPADHTQVRLTCSPTLGQTSSIATDQHTVPFIVLLEATSGLTSDARVIVWHNHNGPHEWSELTLKRTAEYEDIRTWDHSDARAMSRLWFSAELPGLPKHGHAVNFTIKYQLSAEKDWSWIKADSGISDGELHYHSEGFQKHSAHDLKRFFDNISADLKIVSIPPEANDVLLYLLTCAIKPAHGTQSGYQHHRLGRPTDVSRWFSLVRLWSPWLAPRQGESNLTLDKDGILLSFLRTDGMHVVCLAISGIEDVVTTFISDDGNVIVKGRNDSTEAGESKILIAVAKDFEVANTAVMQQARKFVQSWTTQSTAAGKEIETLEKENVKPEWLEAWYDGFTYCTWNALGQKLTAEKIYGALDELAKAKINISSLIIDDNWQSLSLTPDDSQMQRGWIEFEANKEGFPDGLKATTAEIRKRHPNVKHIAVWHAILGYWGGIDPNGTIAKNYKTVEVEKEAGVAEGKFTVVAAEDAIRLYDDFYSFLSKSGIDSVKTDAQFFLDMLDQAPDRRALIGEYQDAWTIAHLRHFSSRAISCMSQTPQILFHSQLPTNKPRLLVRNSDDFFPEIDASHPWHIFCNAHNSILTQHLNVLPDWDMFQTSHDWAAFHAVARCVSGGPIYFTDTPGKHDIKLIRQMTAQTTSDKTIILRPQGIGKSTNPYNDFKAHALLKVATHATQGKLTVGILGVFNVSGTSLTEFIHLGDFPGTEHGEKSIVLSFRSGEISPILTSKSGLDFVGLVLPDRSSEVLSTFPVRSFQMSSAPVSIALLGLLGKMTGAAAVTGVDMYVESNGRLRIWVALKALGVLGLWIDTLPSKSIADDFMVVMLGEPIPVECVRKSENWGTGEVLEVDVERAWNESGQKAGWSNEVTLEIFMG